jgi:regulator of sirC expression with transglutaminase-like and TPR domain
MSREKRILTLLTIIVVQLNLIVLKAAGQIDIHWAVVIFPGVFLIALFIANKLKS